MFFCSLNFNICYIAIMAILNIHPSKNVCPHWSRIGNTDSCTLTVGGLFIPVPRHTDTYCKTANYTTCAQFLKAVEKEAESQASHVINNRRRFERVPSRYPLMFSELALEEEIEGMIDDSALTVDLSPGGMRFESYQPMVIDSLISFTLDSNFSEKTVSGSGLVKWCRSLDSAPVYQIGIAFTDTLAASAIRRQLSITEVH